MCHSMFVLVKLHTRAWIKTEGSPGNHGLILSIISDLPDDVVEIRSVGWAAVAT